MKNPAPVLIVLMVVVVLASIAIYQMQAASCRSDEVLVRAAFGYECVLAGKRG